MPLSSVLSPLLRRGERKKKTALLSIVIQCAFNSASVVSRNWLVFRRKEFSFPARRERRAYPSAVCEKRATKREAKRTAARRVAPKTAWGFVAPRSQSAAAMLPRRALPQAVLGATKHQPIARHHTRRSTNRQPAMPPPSSVHGRHLSFFPQALGP